MCVKCNLHGEHYTLRTYQNTKITPKPNRKIRGQYTNPDKSMKEKSTHKTNV